MFPFGVWINMSCSCKTKVLAKEVLVQEENLLLVQDGDPLLVQEEGFLLVHEKDKEWSPEKLKMARKHFFPELSGDLWGVICYHHWYLRAGLEAQKKSQKKFEG